MKFITRLSYRLRYEWRSFIRHGLGICPDCWNFCNCTRSGKRVCPECGR
jgi:hypothetical protein